MSGEIHSGVQEVILPSSNDATKPLERELRSIVNDNIQGIEISDKINVLSNATEGSLCCEICNIRVTSTKIFQRHLEGKKHISRAERKGKTFRCELCDVTANSQIQLNIHLSSSKHKSRVAREEFKEFTDISSYSISIYVLLFCAFCIVLNLFILVKVAF